MRRLLLTAATLAAGLHGLPADAVAATPGQGLLSVRPARPHIPAIANQSFGPITFGNTTKNSVKTEVFPVFLDQERNGALTPRTSGKALRKARKHIAIGVSSFTLSPNQQRSVPGLLKSVPSSGSLYGGLLFTAQPVVPAGGGIRSVFRINAGLYFDPVGKRLRVRWGSETIRAEQAGRRRLRLVTPVINRGNMALGARGVFRIFDATGRMVVRRRIRSIDLILPRATVELPFRLVRPVLPAGVYRLRADLVGGGKRFVARGEMRLFGPNAVATKRAEILTLTADPAYINEPVKLHVNVRNTGNVTFAPRGEALSQRVGSQGLVGSPINRKSFTIGSLEPGKSSTNNVILQPPRGKRAYEVTVRILSGNRVISSRSLSLSPTVKPSIWSRINRWLQEHVVAVIGGILLLAILIVLVVVRRARRREGHAAPAQRATPAPGPTPTRAIAVPTEQPPTPPPPAPPAPTAGSTGRSSEGSGVDLNTATVEELMTLPGVGRRAAMHLIEHREQNGPFRSLEDVHAVEGFHAARVERIAGGGAYVNSDAE